MTDLPAVRWLLTSGPPDYRALGPLFRSESAVRAWARHLVRRHGATWPMYLWSLP